MALERRLPEPHGCVFKAAMPEEIGFWADSGGAGLEKFLKEDSYLRLEAQIAQAHEQLTARAPFSMAHSADYSLAHFCYGICRATRPRVVVETGVAYGVTSCFILKALEMNGYGELCSIDLPPLTAENRQFQGILVPPELRSRWRLLTGASRRILPELITELSDGIDIFIHDSLHTYRNMLREFRAVWPVLKGLLISDDVEQNLAFNDFVASVHPERVCVIREQSKNAAFGIAMKDASWSMLV